MAKSANRRGRGVHPVTGESKGSGKHVRLHEWLLRSKAWISLSPYARCLYIELCRLYNGNNNGELFLSEREGALRVGCNPKTARKAFRELASWEFIRPVVQGGFTWKQRHATCWMIAEFAYGNNLPTKAFMRHGVCAENKSRHHYAEQTAPLAGADAES
jgi:hypothetical protein